MLTDGVNDDSVEMRAAKAHGTETVPWLPPHSAFCVPPSAYRCPGGWYPPDPLGGDITNPQSLDRYAYALNNPTTLTDPLGLITMNPQGCITDSTGFGYTCPPDQYPLWDWGICATYDGYGCGYNTPNYYPYSGGYNNNGGGGAAAASRPRPLTWNRKMASAVIQSRSPDSVHWDDEESQGCFLLRARFLAALGMTRFRNIFEPPAKIRNIDSKGRMGFVP